MKKDITKILKFIFVFSIILLIVEIFFIYSSKRQKIPIDNQKPITSNTIEDIPVAPTSTQSFSLPESYEINVPFITQAPFRSWREDPFNHTCEEASILMVDYYLRDISQVDENITKKQLLDLVDFEMKHYGFHEDTSVEQTAKLIEDYYGYKTKVSYNISIENIKNEIAAGNPVILPTAGRLLQNENFTPPGPLYHMLVIKGYNETELITQDPGTYRTGESRHYLNDVIENAIHDWNNGDVLNGDSAMIVVFRQ